MVNDMAKTNVNKRYAFGVKIDLLGDLVAKKISNRVSDVRDQAVKYNYVDLDTAATEMYNRAYDLYVQGRYHYEPKFTGERYSLLTHAAGLIVLTHRFNKVQWEVTTAIKAGTSVVILKPFDSFELVRPKTIAEWEDMCEQEANPDWAAWRKELPINLTAVLKTETPWLCFETLDEMAEQYENFEAFLDAIKLEIANIKSEGEWDLDASESTVYNEKASVWHDKERKAHTRYKYGKKEYWYNYEVLPVDTMTEYLHLTYLKSIDYKPLQRIVSDGAEYGTKKYFEFLSDSDLEDGQYEQGLTVTPLYEDPYFMHEGDDSFN